VFFVKLTGRICITFSRGAPSCFRFGVMTTIGKVFLKCNILGFRFISCNMAFSGGARGCIEFVISSSMRFGGVFGFTRTVLFSLKR